MTTSDYKRIEYNLNSFFKLVNNDATVDSQTFLNVIKEINHSELVIENIKENMTSTMLVGKTLFSIFQ